MGGVYAQNKTQSPAVTSLADWRLQHEWAARRTEAVDRLRAEAELRGNAGLHLLVRSEGCEGQHE